MAKKRDVTKHVEAILDRKLGPDELERISFVLLVASSTKTSSLTTQQNIITPDPNQCFDSLALDLSGIVTTGADGRRTFRLSSFICGKEKYRFPINCVATPLSLTPVFITLNRTLINGGEDVEIQAFTWDASGAPAPNIAFDWRCRVDLEQIIF